MNTVPRWYQYRFGTELVSLGTGWALQSLFLVPTQYSTASWSSRCYLASFSSHILFWQELLRLVGLVDGLCCRYYGSSIISLLVIESYREHLYIVIEDAFGTLYDNLRHIWLHQGGWALCFTFITCWEIGPYAWVSGGGNVYWILCCYVCVDPLVSSLY